VEVASVQALDIVLDVDKVMDLLQATQSTKKKEEVYNRMTHVTDAAAVLKMYDGDAQAQQALIWVFSAPIHAWASRYPTRPKQFAIR
jgi:hypothetical protein